VLFWLAVALTLLSGLVYLLPALRSPVENP
jgi:hypothetical protein